MDWINLTDNKPKIGERVIVDTGKAIVGAKLSIYMNDKDLYWLNDLNGTHAYEDVVRWKEL